MFYNSNFYSNQGRRMSKQNVKMARIMDLKLP